MQNPPNFLKNTTLLPIIRYMIPKFEELFPARISEKAVRKNLSGKRFGHLLVLYRSARKNNQGSRNWWICKCDCGELTIVKADNLKKEIRSCGCFKMLPFGEAHKNKIFNTYQYRAKQKDWRFDFTMQDFGIITQQNCFYCGSKPSGGINDKDCFNGHYIHNGIDSNKGYIASNCVSCCSICNYAKRHMPAQDFLNWIEKTYQNCKKTGLIK